jgi:S-adenosylmethionine:tRNA ribosyltransferase-isomerase
MHEPDLDDPATWTYQLPPELIASRPATRRDDARLLVLRRSSNEIEHRYIRDLPELLNSGDLLVFNDTKVLPARLFGVRTSTGGRWEGLFLRRFSDGIWQLLCETRGKLQPGESISVMPATDPAGNGQIGVSDGRGFDLQLLAKDEEGRWTALPSDKRHFTQLLDEFGCMPLPPYMGRRLADADDVIRYQTCFASQPGAVAAPTAGLHFTPELIANCASAGTDSAHVTLHVGMGTFRPMNVERVGDHHMHHEWCQLPYECCSAISRVRQRSGRIVAVGTTSVRTLESALISTNGKLQAWAGDTDLFIRPPFEFGVVDCLLTNFHLPGSTLLIMVAALAGFDLVMEAYRQAIARRYRFFSYGDAMLIL